MIKKHLKLLLITSLATLLPMAAGLILWNSLPAQVPFHWNVAGEIDKYASKAVAVFVMPFVMLALQWVCAFATAADPKNKERSGKIVQLVFWIIPVLSNLLQALVYTAALGWGVRVEVLLPIFLGLVFAVIGNYLPKCKQNYVIGIKLAWTLHSAENWNRTHRLAGYAWVIGGLLMIATAFLGIFWITLSIIILITLVPIVYSYALYRKGI
ncbi:MAG: SdpI family protein [Clostridia bacterium]|nr:SdpI family protein [Clostridia bacterium]MBQ8268653.1 SdpI family protein [Clostridia bacterium]